MDYSFSNHSISEVSVKVLRTLPELEGIRREWESWPGNRDSEIETYLMCLRSIPATVRPHVVVVERDGEPDAILVGRIDMGHVSCHLGYLRLNLPAKIMCFVYGALRGNPSPENCDLIVNSVVKSLSDGEADVAYMNFLKEESDLYRLATQKPGLLCRDHIRITQQHFATRLSASAEEFYKGLSSGARWQAKSKQKKLIKDFAGDVKIRCFRQAEELDAMIQDVEQVARKSYQRGIGVGFHDIPAVRSQLRLKAERGWLRGYVLYVSGKPSAFWIGDINEGTFGSDYLAYDAELGKYSPGMFLMYKVIEGFCEGNGGEVTALDFATGHAQYKQLLSNQGWTESSAYIFSPSVKGIGINVVRSLIEGAGQGIQTILRRTNLLQKVK
ncbi:MAG: GNAT family N-acetyltransferase, partial [Candidatus Sulfotelmatobacter sp.]